MGSALSDTEWDDVAREVLDRTGLAARDDPHGCRWVAVRHAEEHVHLVVTLARQDGRAASTFRDFYRVGEACRAVEDRYGLAATAPRDRTAALRPSRAETEKAHRSGHREVPRVTLAHEVRYAAAASASADDFFDASRGAGVLVRPRYSERTPGEVTGYAVALSSDRNAPQPRAGADRAADGAAEGSGVVWFGGGKLGPDLSWPRLAARWAPAGDSPDPARGLVERGMDPAGPGVTYRSAAVAAQNAAAVLRRGGPADEAIDVPAAAGDLLVVLARVMDGRRGGPLTRAADHLDRAAREPWSRSPVATSTGWALRCAARDLDRIAAASRTAPHGPGAGRSPRSDWPHRLVRHRCVAGWRAAHCADRPASHPPTAAAARRAQIATPLNGS